MLEDCALITLHFTLPVFRTKQGAWHKWIQLMKGFHCPSTRTTNSVRLILFARITSNEPVCIEGWNKFSVPIWSPWEPNLTHRRSGCQLGLLSVNFDFRNVIFQPMVFPFVWAKYKWKFVRDGCKLSFPLPLAASPLARAFSRDSFKSPRACSQATYAIKLRGVVNILGMRTAIAPRQWLKQWLPWRHGHDLMF